MTKKIIWRLKESPTAEKLSILVKGNLLTREEAREVLFNLTEESERSVESLKEEIKFLREIVDQLSQSKSKVVEIIREVGTPYKRWDWVPRYIDWCGTGITDSNVTFTNSDLSVGSNLTTSSSNFSDINTF